MIKYTSLRHRRFTLIELLIVVAIIGILVSILLPSLRRARTKAKIAICLSNQSQFYKGLHLEMKNRRGGDILLYNDGTMDAPDEGISDYTQNGKLSVQTTGNPASHIEEFIGSEVFFCPLGSYTSKENYHVNPRSTSSKHDSWGEYFYLYGKIPKSQEKHGRYNKINNVNEKSEKIVLTDADASYMKRSDKFSDWATEYEHYSGLYSDGSAKYITNSKFKFYEFLWGNTNWGG